MNKKIDNLLNKIDRVIFESSLGMEEPYLNRDLGSIVYFATRYKTTNKEKFKKKAKRLLTVFLDKFNDIEFESGVLIGFEGSLWVLQYLYECGVIKEYSKTVEDIEALLIQSIKNDIDDDYYDLYYGSIGKIQYFLKGNLITEKRVSYLINQLIEKLWNTKRNDNGQIYWEDEEYETGSGFIDLGPAHGILSILLFLGRLIELNHKNNKITPLIEGIILTFRNAKINDTYDRFFPSRYNIKNNSYNENNSRLGFCDGDLTVAYGFYYVGIILENDDLIIYAQNILNLSIHREISESGLREFPKYGYFDIGFCHGLSSITYTYLRLNSWYNNKDIEKRNDYWIFTLINNTERFLALKGTVYYPKPLSYIDDDIILDKYSFTDGILGAGLVLQSVRYNDFKWSSFLGLY